MEKKEGQSGIKNNDYEQISGIARKTITFLAKKKIALTPANYKMWYEYFQGNMTDLNEALDKILESGIEFTEIVAKEVYAQFFVRNLEAENKKKISAEISVVEEVNRQVRGLLKKILNEISTSIKHTSEYSKELEGGVHKVEQLDRVEEIKEVFENLIRSSVKIIESNKDIRSELRKNKNEIEELKKTLDVVRVESLTDNLTSLHNRRAFDIKLKEELDRLQRYNVPCALLLLDVDNFKQLNDTYGHNIGDKALVKIAAEIKNIVRTIDFPCRYGGDEFAVILPSTKLENGFKVAERIRTEIFETEFMIKDKSEEITISGGITGLEPRETPSKIVENADHALYKSKQMGRNQIRRSSEL